MKKFLSAFLLSAALAGNASAATTTYTDEAAFAAAAGTLSLETFSTRTVGDSLAGTIDFGPFSTTLTSNVGGPYFNVFGTSPSLPYGLNAFGLSGTNLQVGLQQRDTFTFTFDTEITAFGAMFAGVNDIVRRSVIFVDGVSTPWLSTTFDLGARFYGVVSSTPFTTVTIRGLRGLGEGFGIDDVRWASVQQPTPVPLPASGVLLLGAMLAAGLLGRRRARG